MQQKYESGTFQIEYDSVLGAKQGKEMSKPLLLS
jgi:hypothetical protein